MSTTAAPAEGRITAETHGAVAVLTIDRPAKLNALGFDMLASLEEHLAAIDRDQAVRAVDRKSVV